MLHAIILPGHHWLMTTYQLWRPLFQVNVPSRKVELLLPNDEINSKEILLRPYSV
jgi:hypothetical protein